MIAGNLVKERDTAVRYHIVPPFVPRSLPRLGMVRYNSPSFDGNANGGPANTKESPGVVKANLGYLSLTNVQNKRANLGHNPF